MRVAGEITQTCSDRYSSHAGHAASRTASSVGTLTPWRVIELVSRLVECVGRYAIRVMLNVIYKQKKVNWICHQVCGSRAFLRLLFDPADPVEDDAGSTIQLRRMAADFAEVYFEKMTHLASMKQKRSRRLFLTSCHVETQYLMRNIFRPFLQLLSWAQVEGMGGIAPRDIGG